MHGRTLQGQWIVGLLSHRAALPYGPEVALQLHTATLLGGSGQWKACCTLPQCPGVVGSGTLAAYCCTALGQWVVDILQYTAALPGGSEQWNSCDSPPPQCIGAVGS